MISLSVIIPAFNEGDRLWPTLSGLAQFLPEFLGHEHFEVILVSDGSRDDTELLMQRWIRHCRLYRHQPTQWQLITLPMNQGKGAAVRIGMLAATGQARLLMDADGATAIEALWPLYEALQQGADLAIASRAVPNANVSLKSPLHRRLLGRCFHVLISRLIPDIYDSQCGFKLFTRESAEALFENLRLSRYLFDVELLMRARQYGFKIAEIPVSWCDVPGSKLSVMGDTPSILAELLTLYTLKLK
jgi:dolichyl-phosphate beta-glucosyltransferase